ncbi:MAG: hypothetical protein KatS3mg105_4067 [Gemmatales bacterium]|nr:MAG: hypothetical protein KatS3mg105_4067 [Gemmatales bacterium]
MTTTADWVRLCEKRLDDDEAGITDLLVALKRLHASLRSADVESLSAAMLEHEVVGQNLESLRRDRQAFIERMSSELGIPESDFCMSRLLERLPPAESERLSDRCRQLRRQGIEVVCLYKSTQELLQLWSDWLDQTLVPAQSPSRYSRTGTCTHDMVGAILEVEG